MRAIMLKIPAARLAAVASGFCLALASATSAFAYSGPTAASYADHNWNNRNIAFPSFSNDCQNFVSQSVNAGDFSMVGIGRSPTNDNYWWATSPVTFPPPNNSHSWSVVTDFNTFQILYYPGGIGEGSAPGTSTNYYTPNSVVTGDVLQYDWGRGAGLSHSSIQVGIGTDPNYPNGQVWYGNYVDQHTSDRYHAFWSLYPYNADRNTTIIYFLHIFSTNT